MILNHLQSNGSASVATLMKLTGASDSTVRRDLLELSERGSNIRRIHGGAVSGRLESSTYEPPATIAARLQPEAKLQIGRAAAAMIEEGQSVMFDSGSTVATAARAAAERGVAMTAITNDLEIARILNACREVDVIVTGGRARPNTNTLYGPPGDALLQNVHVDLLFLGIHAISETGLSESSLEIAEMKKRMVAAAKRVVLLADDTKFGSQSFVRVCGLEAIDHLITNAAPPDTVLDKLREAGGRLKVTADARCKEE